MYIYGLQCDFMQKKSTKTLTKSKSLISLYNLGSRPQKSPTNSQFFCIGMAYIRWYLVNSYVQAVQKMYGKLTPISKKNDQIAVSEKNRYGHNFLNIASTSNQRWLLTYEKTLIHCGTDILKIVTVFFFSDTSYFC